MAHLDHFVVNLMVLPEAQAVEVIAANVQHEPAYAYHPAAAVEVAGIRHPLGALHVC